jgi:hypothetical protein
MMVMVLPRRLGCGAIQMLSHAGGDTTEVTWPLRDIDAESCWRQCYRVMMATALPR